MRIARVRMRRMPCSCLGESGCEGQGTGSAGTSSRPRIKRVPQRYAGLLAREPPAERQSGPPAERPASRLRGHVTRLTPRPVARLMPEREADPRADGERARYALGRVLGGV